MAKTAFQVQCSKTAPEAIRPRRALPPATPAHTLTAWVRRSAGNVVVIVDKVAGMTSDAPSPNNPRNRISSVAEVAVMATAEPDTEDGEADDQGAPAAKLIADGA